MAIKQIVDIVEEMVENLNHTFVITSNTNLGGGKHKLFTDNTYYLRNAKGVSIGGLDYTVKIVDFNKSINVEPVGHASAISVDSFELPAPKFFHGTIKSAEREVLATMESTPSGYPIAYLFEEIVENLDNNVLALVKKNVPIELFFLDIFDPTAKSLNPDLLQNTIKPQSNVTEKFIDRLLTRKVKGIGKLTGTTTSTNVPRFAITNREGEESKIFNENLGGIRVQMTLPVLKNC